jgi:hypothetical protein
MKENYRKWMLLPVAILLVSSATLLAYAVGHHRGKGVPATQATVKQPDEKPLVYDSVMLRRLVSAVHSLDFNRRICTYKGVINMVNNNDTTKNVRGLKFTFCRTGDRYYYQVGSSELIHQDSLNVFILHDQHKIVLSKETINLKPPMNDLGKIEDLLRSESYTLKSSVNGVSQTLSLVNEYHISRKEFSVTLDTVTGRLQRIYTRLTDFGDPMDKHKERTMDVRLLLMQDRADMGLYPSTGHVVQMGAEGWELTSFYKNYELIRF